MVWIAQRCQLDHSSPQKSALFQGMETEGSVLCTAAGEPAERCREAEQWPEPADQLTCSLSRSQTQHPAEERSKEQSMLALDPILEFLSRQWLRESHSVTDIYLVCTDLCWLHKCWNLQWRYGTPSREWSMLVGSSLQRLCARTTAPIQQSSYNHTVEKFPFGCLELGRVLSPGGAHCRPAICGIHQLCDFFGAERQNISICLGSAALMCQMSKEKLPGPFCKRGAKV